MQHKFKTTIELEVTIIAHVAPSVPPRPSSDPDSPAYSDPGDPGERSIEAVFAITVGPDGGGKKIDITDCFNDRELDALANEAYEDAADAAEGE